MAATEAVLPVSCADLFSDYFRVQTDFFFWNVCYQVLLSGLGCSLMVRCLPSKSKSKEDSGFHFHYCCWNAQPALGEDSKDGDCSQVVREAKAGVWLRVLAHYP